jgi:hypothetical protein
MKTNTSCTLGMGASPIQHGRGAHATVIVLCAALLIGLVSTRPARAGVASSVVTEAADYVVDKFGAKVVAQEVGEQGSEVLATRIGTLAAKYGEEESVNAVKKVGPRVFRVVEEVGEKNAPQAMKLMARAGEDSLWVVARKRSMAIFMKYGDDAADAMLRHKEIAEPLIEQFGDSAVKALTQVDGQGARRLAMMAADGELSKIGRTSEVLDVVGRYGDRAMNFVWRNKGALATATVLATFLHDPQPYIDGGVDLAKTGGEAIIKPAVAEISHGMAISTNWTAVLVTGVAAMTGYLVFRRWTSNRRRRLRAA